MCSGFFRLVAGRDNAGRFRFATGQSALGRGLFAALGLPTDDFQTILVVMDGRIHTHADAVFLCLGALGGPWRLVGGLRVLPRWIKTPVYHLVRRNRFRWFGRLDTCILPEARLRVRFVDGGL